jgi:MerR family transcriptional regulator, copper efflux regulator
MSSLTIGQLAKAAAVNVETIRFYERTGIIPTPPRRRSGYRQYPPEFVRRIRFIKRTQELGFSLKETVELLSLRVDSQTVCADVKLLAEAKVKDIEQKIQTLQRMKQILTELLAHCNSQEPTSACPMLAALDTHEAG